MAAAARLGHIKRKKQGGEMKRLIFAGLAAVMLAGGAQAQSYPARPITIVVPFAAGGATDAIARAISERMRVLLGQSVLVENVTRAGGLIGVGRAGRAPPGGFTLSLWHT